VIRAKKLRIQEFRGIRDLTLDFGGKNFAICGPNGTGKSGVVDALEFVLTGNISRLVGAGTGGLSVKEHGPHVDSRNKPDKAVVTLTVDVPSLQKEVTITRSVREAKKPKVVPDTPEVRAVLERVALHPEFTLSRRELIRYVLAEPGKRAKEVQELLRLDEVESVRALLQKIANASEREANTIAEMRDSAAAALRGALVLTKLSAADIVTAANEKRAMLSLPPVPALEANTSIKDGVVSAAAAVPTARVAKAHAKADIAQIRERLDSLSSAEFSSVVADAVAASSDLTKDEHFLQTDLPPVRWTPYSKHTRSLLWPSPRPRRDTRVSSGKSCWRCIALAEASRSCRASLVPHPGRLRCG
jgi:DNA repair exonuclease SbcCD ATPase subunit